MHRLLIFVVSLNIISTLCYCITAESQTVMIQVLDVHDHPVTGAILSAEGNGSTSAPTDKAGKTRISLSLPQPGDELALILVAPKSPMRILSPWKGRGTVPKSSGFVEVVLGRAGDVAALQNTKVVWSMAAAVVETKKESCVACATPITADSALKHVAAEVDLDPSQVDSAVRKLTEKKRDDPAHDKVAAEYMRFDPRAER